MDYEEREKWRQRLGIAIGDTKESALEKFSAWRDQMKTCSRCLPEDRQYTELCPIADICKQADEADEKEVSKDGRKTFDGKGSLRNTGNKKISFESSSL